MKKIALAGVMFVGLLSSCSTDELTVVNESGVAVESIQSSGSCTEASTLGGSATLSSYTGPEIVFEWNNDVSYDANKTYVSYIELAEDSYCPPPAGAPAVAASYPIDVFNTSSLQIAGVSAKCFYWRIVINGYVDSVLECTTTTEWMDATYVQ